MPPTEQDEIERLQKELAQARQENVDLKASKEKALYLKVSQKGGVSLYGMGRFPVTLYKEQWVKLLDMEGEIRRFLEDNAAELKTKG